MRIPTMRALLAVKFNPYINPGLARDLAVTGDAQLVEGNWWERYILGQG